jgi:uncharacterized protein (TIGR02246 family)
MRIDLSQVDVTAIRKVESAYDSAWNDADLASLGACFTNDAVVVNPRGEVAIGARDIAERIGAFLHSEGRGSRHESEIVRVSMLGADVALVDGIARIVGAEGSDRFEHAFTDVLVRRDGRWLLAHVRAYGLRVGS